MKWEYLHFAHRQLQREELDDLGFVGWELVTCKFNDAGMIVAAVFKRPL